METSLQETMEKIRVKDRVTLARTLTRVENEDPGIISLLKELHRESGKAFRIGITGPPGAGKSTLVDCITREFRNRKKSVGIIAVDPTSPFTGGALLGDRIRMSKALQDTEIFMRSMASRGGTGGLARTTFHAIDVMDAFGFDVIIIETVGVGQLELDVAQSVDSTVVVLVPETGGNVQALKAGLVEIADIFVINKSDREGADILRQDLLESLEMRPGYGSSGWSVPIVKTSAVEYQGIADLVDTLEGHYHYLIESNSLKELRIEQKKNRIIAIIKHYFERTLWQNSDLKPFLLELSLSCSEGILDPYTAAEAFLARAQKLEQETIRKVIEANC